MLSFLPLKTILRVIEIIVNFSTVIKMVEKHNKENNKDWYWRKTVFYQCQRKFTADLYEYSQFA